MLKKYPLARKTLKTITQLILAIIVYIIAMIVARRLFMPVLINFYEFNEIQLHAVKGIANMFFIFFAYFLYVKYYEKRKAVELKPTGMGMLYGTLSGVLLISITSVLLFASNNYQVTTWQAADGILLALIGLSSQVLITEILFRGIIFRILEQHIGTVYSLILVPVSYGFLNISVDGLNLFMLISTILISALWCSIFVLSRNIWVVGLHATGWVCAIFLIGILDEHWRVSAPIISSYNGSDIITGGSFGPEASIITIVTVAISLYFVLSRAKRKGQFI